LRNVTIPWFFPPPGGLSDATCSGIPPGYHVNPDDNGSNRSKRGIVQNLPNGNKQIKVWDVVTGTATDNFGNTYQFYYQNDVIVEFDGAVATIHMVDFFALRGKEFSHRLGFDWTWQYTTDSLNLVKFYDADGTLVNIAPDFPTFPTDDGVTETTHPAFVPGSWEIGYEFGQPFGCDPL
jgi:hypothetical protein